MAIPSPLLGITCLLWQALSSALQDFSHLHVFPCTCIKERRPSKVVCHIWICPPIKEDLHHFIVSHECHIVYFKSRVLLWKSSSVDMFRSGSVKETSLHINIAGGGKESKLTSLLEVTFFSAAKLTNMLRLFQINRPKRIIAVKSFKTDQNLFILRPLASQSYSMKESK